MAELSNLLDPIDIDRIREGDTLALADALKKIHAGINRTITRVDQLALQAATTPLYCRLYHSSGTQTITTGTDTFLKWDTPPTPGDIINGVNVGGMFDPTEPGSYGASADEYVFLREPGLYLIEANVMWDTNVTGDRRMNIELLGSLDSIDRVRTPASLTSVLGLKQVVQSLVPWRGLAAGSGTWNGRVAIQVFQNSGGNRTVGSAGVFYDHWLGVTRVGSVR